MGGVATFTGTNHQANTIAFVYTHILSGQRLQWLAPDNDIPIAVEAETEGSGDDLRIELANASRAFEVQAKHGLNGGGALHETLEKIVQRVNASGSDWSQVEVLLAVDGTTSGTVSRGFAADVERIRSGRTDSLTKTTTEAIAALGADSKLLLPRLRIVTVDFDTYAAPDKKLAILMLQSVLADPSMVESAWAILAQDANRACSDRLRRHRDDLVRLLEGRGIAVRRPSREERWRHDIELAKSFRERFATTPALRILAQVERETESNRDDVSAELRRDLELAIGSTLLVANQLPEARAHFTRALQAEPGDATALAQLAQLAVLEGRPSEADSLIEQAIAKGRDNELVWSIAAIVDRAAGRSIRVAPSRIAQSERYQLTRVNLAGQVGAFEEILERTAALLQQGRRPATALVARAHALLESAEEASSTNSDLLREAIELATEALTSLDPTVDPRARQALFLRGRAHNLLGEFDEEAKDLEALSAADPLDPDAIMRRALLALMQEGNEAALIQLQNPVTERFGLLLSLRARIHLTLGNLVPARRDTDRALQLSAEAAEPDVVRVRVADTAVALNDYALAKSVLGSVDKPNRDAMWHATMAKLLLAEGNETGAREAFETAIERAPLSAKAELTAEFGLEFVRRQLYPRAIEILERVDFDALDDHGRAGLARAYMAVGQYPKADELLKRVGELGTERPWTLALAAELARLREDDGAAIAYLERLVASGKATADGEMLLARLYLEADQNDDAIATVDRVMAAKEAEPETRMLAAQILARTGEAHRAMPLAIRAFRDAPNNVRMHTALIALSLMTPDIHPTTPDVVGPDTHVTLTDDDGDAVAYTIVAEPPATVSNNEFLVSDPAVSDLLGKRVGDTVVRGGGWNERKLTVTELKSLELQLVQDAMMNYERRFPNERFLFAMKVGTGESVKSFAPLLASLAQRRRHAEELLRIYRSQGFPLGVVANALGITIGETIDAIAASKDPDDVLLVEWADSDGQQRSFEAALSALEARSEIVMTESALHNLDRLGMRSHLEGLPNLVVPRSLLDSLASRVAELNQNLKREHVGTMVGTESGFALIERKQDELQREADHARELLDWVSKQATVLPRPVEALRAPGTDEFRLREIVGAPSTDAVDLANQGNRVLLADDLGLRRLFRGNGERSFSTVSLILALGAAGRIDHQTRERTYAAMLRSRFLAVRLTPQMLTLIIQHEAEHGREVVDRALSAMIVPPISLATVASEVVAVLRILATSNVRASSLSTTTSRFLETLSLRWPKPAVALAVEREASRVLSLLPNELDEVQRACVALAKSAIPILGPERRGRHSL